MCNKIKYAIQYTVYLIKNNISRDVQEECANRLYRVYTFHYVYISLLIISCIIQYVTNKRTLTLTLTYGSNTDDGE